MLDSHSALLSLSVLPARSDELTKPRRRNHPNGLRVGHGDDDIPKGRGAHQIASKLSGTGYIFPALTGNTLR